MWRCSIEIENILNSLPALVELEKLDSLHRFWKHAFLTENYKVKKEWLNLTALNSYGEKCLEEVTSSYSSFSKEIFLMAMFLIFYHHELFFDWQKTNIQGIASLLQDELLSEKILFPNRFGRHLYDKFNDNYIGNRTKTLPAQEVLALIESTPRGIYQVGRYVIGPLGLLQSPEGRWVPPSLDVPLWHCSDTGCSSLHTVELEQPQNELTKVKHHLKDFLLEKYGQPSEWRKCLAQLHRKDIWPEGRPYCDLLPFLCDCVMDQELSNLFIKVLKSQNGKNIRLTLSQLPGGKNKARRNHEDLTLQLTREEKIQLLCMLKDTTIVKVLDEAVEEGAINIALGEIRTPVMSPGRLSQYDTNLSLGQLGVRSTKDDAIVNLSSLVWRAYKELDLLEELRWQLCGHPESSTYEELVKWIREKGSEVAVKNLVFSNRAISKYSFEKLDMTVNETKLHDIKTINRFLWKLGFIPPVYGNFFKIFEQRLDDFRDTVTKNMPVENEKNREKIRSSGVNLFISVEEFLDQLITYNIWLLASDHFLQTHFIYNHINARESVAKVLGSEIKSDDHITIWNVKGENTLGTLLSYLNELKVWMKSCTTQDRNLLLRPKTELPHYISDKKRSFPFYHTTLWADANETEFKKYLDKIGHVTDLLLKSNLACIRNGLDHKREDCRFPNTKDMLECANTLDSTLKLADTERCIPKIYWLTNYCVDRYGSKTFTLSDCNNRTIEMYGPCLVTGFKQVSNSMPVIVSPGNLLGKPNSQLIFTIKEPNEYNKYWKGYPRRRSIPKEGKS
ncbi:MAG: hypothetical protein JXA96_00895 [Sedimentisphaerales bacterium]|nr:hypothetical protein [Sedimentisphaerales bacterium]